MDAPSTMTVGNSPVAGVSHCPETFAELIFDTLQRGGLQDGRETLRID
jgi:hypothetical protein